MRRIIRGEQHLWLAGDQHIGVGGIVLGELIAFARMDGAPVSSIRIAVNKAWTAARERKSTKDVGEKVRHPEKGHDIAYYGDPRFVGWGGGIPVWKDGQVAGVVFASSVVDPAVGYAIASLETTDRLNRVRAPYNVNRLGQVAALASLQDPEHAARTRAFVLRSFQGSDSQPLDTG